MNPLSPGQPGPVETTLTVASILIGAFILIYLLGAGQ